MECAEVPSGMLSLGEAGYGRDNEHLRENKVRLDLVRCAVISSGWVW